jgi:hypothetical protein
LCRVLSHDQIHAPVSVKIRNGRPALFAIDLHAAFLAGHRAQTTMAISL